MGQPDPVSLSESMQMYLVTIARLRTDGQPVPLSRLAEALSISPVSVNEMCRKLQDQGLVIYRPYKGATLTDDGERRAFHILRRHRLWEVFLVDRLGFDYDQAHEIACQLEHATPEALADRLDVFLEHPAVNPEGEPIPNGGASDVVRILRRLTALAAGEEGHVVQRDVSDGARTFLDEQGIRPGATLQLVAVGADSVLVLVQGRYVSLASSLAEAIELDTTNASKQPVDGEVGAPSPQPTSIAEVKEENAQMQTSVETSVQQITLDRLKAGQRGIVVHVGGKGPAKRRMMDMGLVPGSEVEVVRVAPLGDPVEFAVKGYSLSLRKSEAKLITVEIAD